MTRETLPPDPDAISQWEKLPQNQPSKRALPPIAAGNRWVWGLLALFAVIVIIALLQGR